MSQAVGKAQQMEADAEELEVVKEVEGHKLGKAVDYRDVQVSPHPPAFSLSLSLSHFVPAFLS